MRFQLRRFIDTMPWQESGIVLIGLLLALLLVYIDVKAKKQRCPTCNQIMRKATK